MLDESGEVRLFRPRGVGVPPFAGAYDVNPGPFQFGFVDFASEELSVDAFGAEIMTALEEAGVDDVLATDARNASRASERTWLVTFKASEGRVTPLRCESVVGERITNDQVFYGLYGAGDPFLVSLAAAAGEAWDLYQQMDSAELGLLSFVDNHGSPAHCEVDVMTHGNHIHNASFSLRLGGNERRSSFITGPVWCAVVEGAGSAAEGRKSSGAPHPPVHLFLGMAIRGAIPPCPT